MLDAASDSFHLDLREARRAIGLNQDKFAEKVNISCSALRHYEAPLDRSYARRPTIDVVERINEFIVSQDGDENELSGDLYSEMEW